MTKTYQSLQMFDKSHTINTLHANFQSHAHLAQLNGNGKRHVLYLEMFLI